LKLICKNCGRSFEGKNERFCNNGCRDSYIDSLEKRVSEATKKDTSHTKKLSRS